jgi:putative DNA primase/helicase
MTLLPHHQKELRESGLSDQTITAAGIFSEIVHANLAAILNRKRWPRTLGNGLVFPFKDEAGAIVLHRVKPDNRPSRNGKPGAKYLSPVGSQLRLYVPPSVNGELQAADKPILIVEGEKKALKGSQEGFLTVGLIGVEGWHKKNSTTLIPDLERIAWKGRKTHIVFDSDAASNENVRTNESLLAAALQNRGATVKIVRLPPGENGEKVGLDDYLMGHGPADMHKLLSEAVDPEPPAPEDLKAPASEADPASEAESMLKADEKDGLPRLRFWRGTFWRWSKGAYRELVTSEVRARVVRVLNASYFKVTASLVVNVLDQLRAQSILWGDTEPPCWIGDPPKDWAPRDVLATRSELVHLPSLAGLGGDPTAPTMPATPRLFTTAAVDYNVSPDSPPPKKWLAFLSELWPDDTESIEALQTWFGYCLTPDTSQHKILLVIGPRRSGKGTIARVLRAVLGQENVCGPSLVSLTGTFGLQPLIGKSVAIAADARVSGRADQAAVVEHLLKISGEDALTVNRKYLESLTCTLPTRFVILANELPRLGDSSGALSSRFVVLRLTESFYGREDTALTAKLLAELPSIAWWSIEGWLRLQEARRFMQPSSAMDLVSELENLTSPVGAFVREQCYVGPEYAADVDDAYKAWCDWCEQNGRKHPGTKQSFGRDLQAALPKVRVRQPRQDGGRVRVYEGVGLRG